MLTIYALLTLFIETILAIRNIISLQLKQSQKVQWWTYRASVMVLGKSPIEMLMHQIFSMFYRILLFSECLALKHIMESVNPTGNIKCLFVKIWFSIPANLPAMSHITGRLVWILQHIQTLPKGLKFKEKEFSFRWLWSTSWTWQALKGVCEHQRILYYANLIFTIWHKVQALKHYYAN